MKKMLLFLLLSLFALSCAGDKQSASSYYNKSYVDYKQGHMLDAFLNNRRAALYEPLDRDNNFNLPLIQKSFVEQNSLDIALPVLLTGWLTWSWLWALSSCVFFCYLILWAIFPSCFQKTKWVLLLITILLLGNIGFRSTMILNNHQIVVSAERSSIHSGPENQYPILYWVHQGLMGEQVGHRAGWSLIRLPNGDEGWIADKDRIVLKKN